MTRPDVVLYGHRLGRAGGTGISVYVRELVAAVAAVPGSGLRFALGASREPPRDPPPPVHLPVRRPPVPRKALHAAWTELGAPAVDRFVGGPRLLHVLYPSCRVPSRCPVVYTLHDLMPLTNPDWFAQSERRMFRRALADAARRADALIADSEWIADMVVASLGVDVARISVVPLGVSGSYTQPPPVETIEAICRRHGVRPGRYVIIVGAVSVRKNPGPVLAALRSGLDDLTLLMVGPPGAGAEIVARDVQRQGLQRRVRMTGWVPLAHLVGLLAGAVALVHPSLDEGFGMTPLEAMAAGVPAVVSDAGSLPGTVGDAALLVPAADPTGWAEAIKRVAGDAELRHDLVARGRQRAAEFTWERTARETIAVYRRCLGR